MQFEGNGMTTVNEGDLLWTPSRDLAARSPQEYMNWLAREGIVECETYHDVWRWSVDNIAAYWASIWDYFSVISETPYRDILVDREIGPRNDWFVGARVNFAEHILCREREDATALYALSETRPLREISWTEFASQVRTLAVRMKALGVKSGDAVACIMPTVPETVVAMLATIS
ncbi:MAG: AMP-binding protein, partial [Pseudomonadota bacterium]